MTTRSCFLGRELTIGCLTLCVYKLQWLKKYQVGWNFLKWWGQVTEPGLWFPIQACFSLTIVLFSYSDPCGPLHCLSLAPPCNCPAVHHSLHLSLGPSLLPQPGANKKGRTQEAEVNCAETKKHLYIFFGWKLCSVLNHNRPHWSKRPMPGVLNRWYQNPRLIRYGDKWTLKELWLISWIWKLKRELGGGTRLSMCEAHSFGIFLESQRSRTIHGQSIWPTVCHQYILNEL